MVNHRVNQQLKDGYTDNDYNKKYIDQLKKNFTCM